MHPVTKSKLEMGVFTTLVGVLLILALSVAGVMWSSAPASVVTGNPTIQGGVDYLNPGSTGTMVEDIKLETTIDGETTTAASNNPDDSNSFLRVGLDRVREQFVTEISPNDRLTGVQGIVQLIVLWINFFLSFYVVVAVLVFIVLGIRFLLSAGNEDRRKEIVKMLISFVIATFVIICSYAIIQLILFFAGMGRIVP